MDPERVAFHLLSKGRKQWLSEGISTFVSFDPGEVSYRPQREDCVLNNTAAV